MAVLEGLKLVVSNWDELNLPKSIEVADFPSDPLCSTKHKVDLIILLSFQSLILLSF